VGDRRRQGGPTSDGHAIRGRTSRRRTRVRREQRHRAEHNRGGFPSRSTSLRSTRWASISWTTCSLRTSAWHVRSASLGCPSCCWAGTGSGGCAGCWPRTGWAPNGSTPTPGKAREGGPVDTPAIELGRWSNLSRDHRPAGPGPGHRPRRVQDVGIGSARRKGHGGRNPAGIGTGRRPPEAARRRLPPGPSTAHGVRNPTAERRRETGAAAPGFADRTLFPGGCPVLSS
jgi:hypothetical protein